MLDVRNTRGSVHTRQVPSGPVIVVTFGAFLGLAGLAHFLIHSRDRARSLLRVALGGLAFASALSGSALFRKRADLELVHLLEQGTKAERVQALALVVQSPGRWNEIEPLCSALLSSGDIEVRLSLLDLILELEKTEMLPAVEAQPATASRQDNGRARVVMRFMVASGWVVTARLCAGCRHGARDAVPRGAA